MNTNVALRDEGNPPEPYSMSRVTPGFFDMLGVQPAVGRRLTPADAAAGADPVILLSYSVWRDRYGQSPDAVGRTVRAGNDLATVIGVMPEGFGFPNSQQLWMPLVDTAEVRDRSRRNLTLIGKHRQGVSREQAACGSRRDRAAVGGGVSRQRGSWREGKHIPRAPERRTDPHRVHPDAGRRGFRAAHRLRQRREHDAEPCAGARARDVGARSHGRLALADHSATARGSRVAQSPRRSGRSDHRALRRTRFRSRRRRRREAVLDPVRDGLHGLRLLRRGLPRQCGALRARAGAARLPRRLERDAQGGFARHRVETRRHAFGRFGCVPVHAGGRAPCRGRPVRARALRAARQPRRSARGGSPERKHQPSARPLSGRRGALPVLRSAADEPRGNAGATAGRARFQSARERCRDRCVSPGRGGGSGTRSAAQRSARGHVARLPGVARCADRGGAVISTIATGSTARIRSS